MRSVNFTQTLGAGRSARFYVKVSAGEKGATRGAIPEGGGLGASHTLSGRTLLLLHSAVKGVSGARCKAFAPAFT